MAQKLNLRARLLRRIKKDKKATARRVWIALLLTFCFMLSLDYLEHPRVALAGDRKDPDLPFTALFLGQVELGPHVAQAARRHGAPYLFAPIRANLAEADFVAGGFTGPAEPAISAEGNLTVVGAQRAAPADSASILKDGNFNAVSLAGTGPIAAGEAEMPAVITAFRRAGIATAGAGRDLDQAMEIAYSTVEGIRVAVLAVNDSAGRSLRAQPDRGGVLPADPGIYMPLVREARRNADLVIVYAHWDRPAAAAAPGAAASRQGDIAKALADAGADIVIGSQPGPVGPVEIYRDTLIIYNMGGLVTDQGWTSPDRLSLMARYRLAADGKAAIALIPLWVRGARPHPITGGGLLSRFRRAAVFQQLAVRLPAGSYTRPGDYLVVEVDHRHVLEGVLRGAARPQ